MMAAGMDPRSSWSRTTPADLERSLFLPGAGGFLAVGAGGEALGCVGYRPDGEATLTLNKLATRPGARGQGVGRLLVREVEHVARMGGYERILLAVSQYNLDVLPFYRRLGYVRCDEPYAHAHPASPPPVVLVKEVRGEQTP
ncbi:GNAT family N-acetyltransferase [Deinococcus arcticus]|uniref:GNAT family N-acetyltransferase n=2 Tax=Deinococcus arcticus TaxID=2136176 RepID=A0A2T3WAX1_9DEIO|nr:GNAT family N-acetyltransferase [Deinococcus arcticus]